MQVKKSPVQTLSLGPAESQFWDQILMKFKNGPQQNKKNIDRHWQELHKGDKKAPFSKQHTFSASCVTVKFERLQLLHIWLSSLLYTDQERYKNQGLKTKYKKNFF